MEETFSAALNDLEKALLEKLKDAQGDVNEGDSRQSFINGFRLGALVMVEVFAGRDSLVFGSEEG